MRVSTAATMAANYTDAALLQAAAKAQQAAFGPSQSVYVAANAGTGKTTVLTRRLLALLLHDEALQPREILALTFTRAAAAEMAVRLPKLVAEFAACAPAQLAEKITTELGLPALPNANERLAEISGLLAQAPPLMTTLHGFAQHLLAALPAAAGLPEGFGLLDEAGQWRLLTDVQQELVQNLPEALAPYLATLLDELGEQGWDDLTSLTLRNWWQLEARLPGQGVAGIATLLARLEAELALPPEAQLYVPQVPSTQQRDVLTARGKNVTSEAAWVDFLLTKLEPRKRILTKAEATGLDPAFLADLDASAAMVSATCKARKAWRGFKLTEAVLTYSAYVQMAYSYAKQQRGMLDFADLLRALNTVLHSSAENTAAQWLWHRLDRRFKHLVVDEAQDNNAAQGRVVQWLTAQLLAGEVGSTPRTVLAVGDVKQSVYRFQGARPQEFYDLRALMQRLAPPKGFTQIELTTTFRNGSEILNLVNAVFANPLLAELVQSEAAPWPTHRTVVPGRPSRVEVWPLVGRQVAETPAAAEAEAPAHWPLAHERLVTQRPSAKVQCLQQLVGWVQAQYAAGVVLPSTGQPLAYEDVLVLVQTNATAKLVAGLLRRAGVPVAAPRGEPPAAVQDVLALLRVAYNQADNLALAQVLKGLEGWDDTQLANLGQAAGDGAWWEALPEDSGLRLWLAQLPQPLAPARLVQAAVAQWGLDLAQFTPLLAWAEAAHATPDPRLGPVGSLVQRLETEALPVVPAAGVRVLTLHTAKGLEAPLVVLADAGEPLVDLGKERLLWGEGLVLYKQGEGLSRLEDTLLADLAHNRTADSLRALYVATTRAADWLVVTGWSRAKNPTSGPQEA